MKAIGLGLLLTLSVLSPVLAQEGSSSSGTTAQARAAAAKARMESQCAAITAYGEAQPPAAATPQNYAVVLNNGISDVDPSKIVSPTAPKLAYAPIDAPQPPAGTVFGGVAGVGLLSNGHLIVYQRSKLNELLEYDSNNRLLRTFDDNIAVRPHGMRIDRDNNIWITDVTCNTVMKLSPSGDVLMTLGTKGKAGTWDEASGAHLFTEPTDIGFATNGDVFVSTGHGGNDPRIVKFDKNGKYITSWSLRHEDGSVATIHTMVVDKNNIIYAGDREAKAIRVFDANGKHLRDIPMSNLICGLYIDKKGQLWMTAGREGMVMRLDWSGKILEWTGSLGKGPGEFGEAHYMVLTPDLKTMYVADTDDFRITEMRATN